jgi:hypothetical protein
MEKISWTDRARNEKVLHRVKEERNILHTVKRGKANWIGHSLRRNCLLKHVTEAKVVGRTEVTGRRGRRHKQLLYDLRKGQDTVNRKRKHYIAPCGELALRGCGPVVRQAVELTN